MERFGQYLPRKSMIHELDPRVKIIAVITLSIMVFHVDKWALVFLAAALLAISELARIKATTLLKSLRPVLPLFLCLFLLYLFLTPGKPIPPFPFGALQMTDSGLYLGLIQISKFIILVLAAALLTMSTTASAISSGLERLLRPLKWIGLSSHDIAMMVTLALRFLPALMDQMNQINEAQLARGGNVNQHRLSGKIKAISSLAVPLLMNVLRSSDQLVDAMEARGYQTGSRTYLYELSLNPAEVFLIISFVLSLVIVLLK